MSDQLAQGSRHTDPALPRPAIHLVEGILDCDAREAVLAEARRVDWRGSASQTHDAPTRQVGRLDLPGLDLDSRFAGVFPHQMGGARYLGLSNERIVIARYLPGDFFALHTDAPYVASASRRSGYSVLLYLNDDFIGGETFFPDLMRKVRPRAGAALFFDHSHRHRGCEVASGEKYVMHLFAMYGCEAANAEQPRGEFAPSV